MDIIHQGQEKCVEVPQEERKDASQLPLQSNAWVVILQGSNGFKQRGTKHPEQGHHDLHLRSQPSPSHLCHRCHLLGCQPCMPKTIGLHCLMSFLCPRDALGLDILLYDPGRHQPVLSNQQCLHIITAVRLTAVSLIIHYNSQVEVSAFPRTVTEQVATV